MRLIDADKLELDTEWNYNGYTSYSQRQIDDAPTVFDDTSVIDELDKYSRCMTIEHDGWKEHLSAIERTKVIEIIKNKVFVKEINNEYINECILDFLYWLWYNRYVTKYEFEIIKDGFSEYSKEFTQKESYKYQ